MNEMLPNWNDLKLFLAVARHKGLSGAAAETGMSAATLGRRMQSLEQSTRMEIFRRHARGYDLTDQGDALFAKISELDAGLRPVFERREGADKTLVKLSAGQWTLQALSSHIVQIKQAAPDAMLRFISADEYLNINHREAVIGIRNQRPHQNGLAGRCVGRVKFASYASDSAPKSWIRVTRKTPSAHWLAQQPDIEFAMEVNASHLAKEMALRGIGRVLLPCFIGDHVAGLQRIGAPIEELEHDQWLVSHDEDRFIPAVRHVLDETYEVLSTLLKSQR